MIRRDSIDHRGEIIMINIRRIGIIKIKGIIINKYIKMHQE